MQVHVVNGLARVVTAIEDGAESGAGNSHLRSDVLRRLEEILEDMGIFGPNVEYIPDMLFRNDQYVHRRLGANVEKREYAVVLVNFFAR